MSNNIERYELMKVEIIKARCRGDFKTEIFLAERLGFYFYAGKVSELHGLFKRAYENFKKEKEYGLMDELASINNLQEIKQLLSSKKSLTAKEIHENERFYGRNCFLINERYDHGNWKKIWANKINDDLIRPLKNYQTGQRSYDRIKTYN